MRHSRADSGFAKQRVDSHASSPGPRSLDVVEANAAMSSAVGSCAFRADSACWPRAAMPLRVSISGHRENASTAAAGRTAPAPRTQPLALTRPEARAFGTRSASANVAELALGTSLTTRRDGAAPGAETRSSLSPWKAVSHLCEGARKTSQQIARVLMYVSRLAPVVLRAPPRQVARQTSLLTRTLGGRSATTSRRGPIDVRHHGRRGGSGVHGRRASRGSCPISGSPARS
jgi:hypothetical protein